MEKSIWQTLLSVALILALLMSITASSALAQSATAYEDTEIVMWTFLDPYSGTSGREAALAKMIASFEAETGITCKVECMEYGILASMFLTACASGNAPDLIWVSVSDIGNVITQGRLAPLEECFMDEWTQEEWADADTPAFRAGVDEEGLHYQLPFSTNYIGLIYRTDLLAEAGYDFSDGSGFASWEDFYEAVGKLTVETDSVTGTKRYGYGSAFPTTSADTILLSNLYLDKNGAIWNEDGTAAWANEAGLMGVEMISNMLVNAYMSDTCLSDTVNNLYEDFKAGKYAMINGPSSRLANLIAGAAFDPSTIRLMPYPSDDGGFSPSVLSGWCVGIWNESPRKRAAGAFLEHMFYNDELWVIEGGQPPMLRSTEAKLAEANFFEDPANLFVKDIVHCITNASVSQPTAYSISGWRNDLTGVLQNVLVNGAEPMTALEDAEFEFNDRNGR